MVLTLLIGPQELKSFVPVAALVSDSSTRKTCWMVKALNCGTTIKHQSATLALVNGRLASASMLCKTKILMLERDTEMPRDSLTLEELFTTPTELLIKLIDLD